MCSEPIEQFAPLASVGEADEACWKHAQDPASAKGAAATCSEPIEQFAPLTSRVDIFMEEEAAEARWTHAPGLASAKGAAAKCSEPIAPEQLAPLASGVDAFMQSLDQFRAPEFAKSGRAQSPTSEQPSAQAAVQHLSASHFAQCSELPLAKCSMQPTIAWVPSAPLLTAAHQAQHPTALSDHPEAGIVWDGFASPLPLKLEQREALSTSKGPAQVKLKQE